MMIENAKDSSAPSVPPLQRIVVVDLDDTLIKSDTLHEQLVRLIFSRPRLLPRLVLTLAKGRAAFKAFCADHAMLDPATLHACEEVLDFVRAEKDRGSRIVLCTAADHRVAHAIAEHLGVFDEVIATNGPQNLKGPAKAEILRARFPAGYIYAGDNVADIAVWLQSAGIVLVGVSPAVERKAKAIGKPIVAELRVRSRRNSDVILTWARALRVHHW